MTDTTQPRPYDEQAALQELERLADKIQSSRRQRAEAVAEFESFVKTFRNDHYEELISQHESALQSEVHSQPAPAHRAADRGQDVDAAVGTHGIQPGAPTSPRDQVVQSLSAETSRPGVPTSIVSTPYFRPALAGAAAVLLIALAIWVFRTPSVEPLTEQPATPTPSATAPETSPAPPAVASTGPARALNIELMTIRPVWMRVTVDGERVIEREFPAGRQIPVQGDKLIQIRAGDGGAVRLSIGGKDQGVLGRDGQIANRTLTAPPPR